MNNYEEYKEYKEYEEYTKMKWNQKRRTTTTATAWCTSIEQVAA